MSRHLHRRAPMARARLAPSAAWLGWLLVLALCPSLAAAATYASAPTSFNWVDASSHTKLGPTLGGVYSPNYQFTNPGTCGTNPPAIDDALSDNVPIGFAFVYGGTAFTQVRLMSNGRLQFNDNTWCGYGSPVTQQPYPDGNLNFSMRIYGADLDPSLQSEVVGSYSTPCTDRNSCYVSYATVGVAPNRRFVATWNNVPEWADFTQAVGSYNLQIILQENGDFIYQYGPHAPGPGSVPAQIGWELGNTDYAETAVGYPAENSAIRYTTNVLVSNGGFEAGAGGNGTYTYQPGDQGFWLFAPGAGITGANSGFTSANSPPPEGRLAAFLQGQGAIAQTGVAAAGNYVLTFRLVNRANYGCQQGVAVSVDGTTVLALPVPAQPIPSEWMHVATPAFALAAGSHTVQLAGTQSVGDCTAFVDDVKLQAAPAFAPTQILGSFEEWQIGAQNYHYNPGAQPWAFTVGSGLTANGSAFGSPPAPQGAQAAFVQDGGYMTQTWVDAGNSYQLSFSAAGRVGYGVPTLSVSIDGAALANWTLTNSGYAPFSASLTLAAGPHTVRFSSAGGDAFVDDVKLSVSTASTAGGFNVFESSTAAGSIVGVIHTKVAGAAFALDVVALNSGRTAVLGTFTGSVTVELSTRATTAARSTAAAAAPAGRRCPAARRRSPSPPPTTAERASRSARPTPGATCACASPRRPPARRRPSPARATTSRTARRASPRSARAMPTPPPPARRAASATPPPAATCIRPAAPSRSTPRPSTPAARRRATTRARRRRTRHRVRRQRVRRQRRNADADRDGGRRRHRSAARATTRPAASRCSSTTAVSPPSTRPTARASPSGRSHRRRSSSAGSFPITSTSSRWRRRRCAPSAAPPALRARSPTSASRSATRGAAGDAVRAQRGGGDDRQLPRRVVEARRRDASVGGPAGDAAARRLGDDAARASPATTTAAASSPRKASDCLRFTRPGNAPVAPFDAQISLSWSVRDTSETTVAGNAAIASAPLVFANMAFDAGAQFRYGVLRLVPAYGSELLDLPVLVEAQYWDGVRLATHAADQCTAVPATSVALGNYQRSLAACKTAVAAAGAAPRQRAHVPAPRQAGQRQRRQRRPRRCSSAPRLPAQTCSAVGAAPSAAAAANLPWLQGKWGGAAAFDQNPLTRASFGQYRSPFIYQRETF